MIKEEIIQLEGICKFYKVGTEVIRALQGITLTLYRNEYIAIMGASGSGKSTLMNVLGCLDTPTSGSYFLNSQDVSSLDGDSLAHIRNKDIGFIFQAFNLLPRLTVLENVMLPLEFQGTVTANPKVPLLDLTVVAPDVELGPAARAVLAPAWQAAYDELDPKGHVAATWKLTRPK